MPADTKKRILDAAERLFAVHGVQGTSLRLISRKARVNLAAINYHFGSKENLARVVVGRLIIPLDRERDRLLEQAGVGRACKEGGGGHVQEIVQAFLLPWFSFRRKHPQYVRIIARMYGGRDPTDVPFRDLLRDASCDAYTLFIRALTQALPGLPQDVLLPRVNLAVVTAASFLLIPWLAEGLEALSGKGMDETTLIDHLARLIESGLPGEGLPEPSMG